MTKRFKELRGRISEEVPTNSTGAPVATDTPIVRKPPTMLRRLLPKPKIPKALKPLKPRLKV